MSTVCNAVAGLLFVVIGTAAPGIHAQSVRTDVVTDTSTRGSILGEVIDAATGRPVALAQVRIRGTAIGSITDLSGRFAIRVVPYGSYTLDIKRSDSNHWFAPLCSRRARRPRACRSPSLRRRFVCPR